MIPIDSTQNTKLSGKAAKIGEVTVTSKTIPLLINALADKIYKNKILAIIREYSSNAWDAHKEKNIPISKIIISLPTTTNPLLKIRDFGCGLSMKAVRDIYCILGESTKRETNELTGQLGLGSKSGFAYGDSFMVTSWYNGKKTIYNIIKGDNQKCGDVVKLAENSGIPKSETGIEISIPITLTDIHEVVNTAAQFFSYWEELPSFENKDNDFDYILDSKRKKKPLFEGEGWKFYSRNDDGGYVKMGPIAYPIDWRMMKEKLSIDTQEKQILYSILKDNNIVFDFNIGEINFTINREELEYTETTVKNLGKRIEEFFDVLLEKIKKKFDSSSCKTIWEAKLLYKTWFSNYGYSYERDQLLFRCNRNDLSILLKDKIKWNGVCINSSYFKKVSSFDIRYPQLVSNDQVELKNRCYREFHLSANRQYNRGTDPYKEYVCKELDIGNISVSKELAIILVVGPKKFSLRKVAKHFLISNMEKYKSVGILHFANNQQKKLFFDKYSFHSVPVFDLQPILDEIKKLDKSSKETQTPKVSFRFLTVKDKKNWDIEYNEISTKEVDKAIYIKAHRSEVSILDSSIRISSFIKMLNTLTKHTTFDVDTIILVTNTMEKQTWFQKKIEDKSWIPLENHINDEIQLKENDSFKIRYHFKEFYNSDYDSSVTMKFFYNLNQKIENDELSNIFKNIEFNFQFPTYYEEESMSYLKSVTRRFKLKLHVGKSPFPDLKKEIKQFMDRYPMLKLIPKSNNPVAPTDIGDYLKMAAREKSMLDKETTLV